MLSQRFVYSIAFRYINHTTSPQVRGLWVLLLYVIWGVWFARNACKFDSKQPNLLRIKHAIISWVREAGGISKGSMFNTVQDLKIVGVPCNRGKAPRIVEVTWYPPLAGWIKCNTDGLCKSSGAGCL